MKERPILFSAPMVRGLLDGSKTQTRRVVKCEVADYGGTLMTSKVCPYGLPGDRLWVRETWTDLTATHGRRWEKLNRETRLYERGMHPFAWYRADGDQPDTGGGAEPERWIPSIHMPRWASRIDLEVTGVRVERLQDISEADAEAEGCDCLTWNGHPGPADLIDWPLKTVDRPWANGYAVLWESINGDGSWEANPWVWVVEFRRTNP